MEMLESKKICTVCNINIVQYKCPKCSIDYCSLNCFKDPKHVKCAEKFYEQQICETLKTEKVSELSDEREKMIKILEKLNNFELEDKDESESDEFDVDLEDLDNLNVEELEELLGDHHLSKVKEIIETGVTSEWLKSAGLSTENNDVPWFMRYFPNPVILNEDELNYLPKLNLTIPDIKTLTKKTPSDFLWNNLIEICVIYSFIYFQFTFTELKDSLVIENEVIPVVQELCSSLMQHISTSSQSGNAMFTSAVEALEAAKSSIFFNSSDHNLSEILDGVMKLLKHPKMLLLMLSDMISWFQRNSKNSKDTFLAEKKLIFMAAWIKSEVEQSKGSVNEILKTLTTIVEQFK